MRSDKTHGHKPRRHIKLLLFLTGCGSEPLLLLGTLSVYPPLFRLSSRYSILYHTWSSSHPFLLPPELVCSLFYYLPFSFSSSLSLPVSSLVSFSSLHVPLLISASWHTTRTISLRLSDARPACGRPRADPTPSHTIP